MDFNVIGNINRLELQNEVRKLTLSLYENPATPRTEVQKTINSITNFISQAYVPFLQKELERQLSGIVDSDVKGKIHVTLEENKLPFQAFKTEYLRFRIYEKESFFFQPEHLQIGKHKITGEGIYAAYIPIKKTLKLFLELPGIYESIKSNIEKLNTKTGESEIISNIVQAKLWKRKYCKNGRNSIPCILSFDDVETGNALGSRAGEKTLAMTYLSLPALPPELADKLTNIFLVMIFNTKDKQHCTNSTIFGRIIQDLRDLSINGLLICVNGIEEKVYFDCPLIAGDNKGLNEICGFAKSFSATYYCRICRVKSVDCKTLTEENVKELRTIESYALDAQNKTGGVHEECVFNQLPNFHITENYSIDLMHDLFEGSGKDVIELVLSQFILKEKLFSLEEFNRRLHQFDFGYEKSNHPRPISTEKCNTTDEQILGMKTKIKVKQSATEMACLLRYLGFILDDLIPTSSEFWKLYIYLRRIIGIVTAPRYVEADLYEIKDVIEKFNTLFLKLYKRLKPKPHFHLHMKRAMEQNGPPVHYWAMSFERKHRTYKSVAVGTSSSKDLPFTIAIKNQILLSCRKESYVKVDTDYDLGPVKSDDALALLQIQKHISRIKSYKFYKHITIIGHKYTDNSVFMEGVNEYGEPAFAKLKHIIQVNNDLFFHACLLITKSFNDHYHAHEVIDNTIPNKLIPLNKINRMPPCLLFKNVDSEYYVACRYD